MVEKLTLFDHKDHPELLAATVFRAIRNLPQKLVHGVTKNPAELSDTNAWIKVFGVTLDETANVVIVEFRKTKHAEREHAAVLVLASARADLNGAVKKHLGAYKVSFLSQTAAEELTGMESGGMSPIGLPRDWPVLVDSDAVNVSNLYIGSGIRASKLVVDGKAFREISSVEILPLKIAQLK